MTSSTRSSPSHTSRARPRRPARNSSPVLAPIALPYPAAVPVPPPSARQTRSGVRGMSRWRTPQVRERIDDRVLHGRDGADGARLAEALGPERVHVGRRLHVDQLEARQLGRRDHRVVGEVGGDRVAVVVVLHPSISAWATPWAIPPWIWPSTIIGLSTVPASSTATCRRSTTLPVSVSTSTTATWAPKGNVGCRRLEVADRPIRGCAGSGRRGRPSRPTRLGEPATWKRAAPRVEHDVVDRGLEQVGHLVTGRIDQLLPTRPPRATPATCTDREPTVRPPTGTWSVSPCTTSTSSIGTPVGRRRSSSRSCRGPGRTAWPR